MFFNNLDHRAVMAVTARKRRKLKLARGISLTATEALDALQQSPSCAVTLRYVLETILLGGQAAESFAEDLLADGFLHLIPSILRNSTRNGLATGVEVLGALSMSSLTVHRKVVSDKNAVSALAEILLSTDVELLTIACHAVVDLLITPFGCEALKESPIISHLLRLLCSVDDLNKGAQSYRVDEENDGTSLAAGEGRKPFGRLLSAELSNNIQSAHGEFDSVSSSLQETASCDELDELIITATRALSALIRNLHIDNCSQELRMNAFSFLRKFWHSLLRKDQILLKCTAPEDEPKWTSNDGTRQLIAKCIVQLAMELDRDSCRKPSAQMSLFENVDFNQKLFFEKYWEQTPTLLGRELPSCLTLLSKKFTSLAAFVNNFLGWFGGCPRAAGDQLDSLDLLGSIENNLGKPMIYGQDIRMVKTVVLEPDLVSPLMQTSGRTVEMHYKGNNAASESHMTRYVHPREILQAVNEGYTVAIKGMELRCSSIADVANCLARQCGQPSVGVNLYLTPPQAQGLDLHYDDHCVFVCQLLGRKIWNVFPPQRLLPRLYACRALNRGAINKVASTDFNVEEGDILYIPRGFPHKARCEQQENISGTSLRCSRDHRTNGPNFRRKHSTPVEEHLNDLDRFEDLGATVSSEMPEGGLDFGADQCSNSSPDSFSLHLTFGVEVEPPFEWEGLVHVALRLWAEQRWQMQRSVAQSDCAPIKEPSLRQEQFCEGLLHIAINLLGEKEVLLRKACMIAAATPLQSSSASREEALASPQNCACVTCEQDDSSGCNVCAPASLEHFQKLLELVAHKASFQEAFGFGQGVSGEYIDSFTSGMEWLRHVPHPTGQSATSATEPIALVMSEVESNQFKEVNALVLEETFSNMKAEFGKAASFHQACAAFVPVYRQYRNVRRKISEGMLALHDNC